MISIHIHVDPRLTQCIRFTRKTLANRKVLAGLAAVALTVPLVALASPLAVPHSFATNTVISSSEMNANFTAVRTSVNDNDTRITALEADPVLTSCVWANLSQASTNSVTVPCPASHFPVSGSCISTTAPLASRPSPDVTGGESATTKTGWYCAWGGATTTRRAVALCCPN